MMADQESEVFIVKVKVVKHKKTPAPAKSEQMAKSDKYREHFMFSDEEREIVRRLNERMKKSKII